MVDRPDRRAATDGGPGERRRPAAGWTAAMPPVTALLLLGPVALGLVGILALATGLVGPAARPGAAIDHVARLPGLVDAVRLTVWIALVATVGSLVAALALLALLPRRAVRLAALVAAPLVALP